MKILVTGHTGFKGSWLSVLLSELGHEVSGLSLPARPESLYRSGKLGRLFSHDEFGDITSADEVKRVLDKVGPEKIFHLAAQPLVRYSYQNPLETYNTNVQGTLNVLNGSLDHLSSSASLVVVTTDKVYKDLGLVGGYDEMSPLGGADPYSASKAMADILTQSWIACNPNARIAIARAGNVIGGGDDSAERLLPDLIQAFENRKAPILRNPTAVRPWQHVLDCIFGYWTLSGSLDVPENRSPWNFGPEPQSFAEVKEVAAITANLYGSEKPWQPALEQQPHETTFLTLNSEKAKSILKWRNTLNLEQAIGWTVDWHKSVRSGVDPFIATQKQVITYLENVR